MNVPKEPLQLIKKPLEFKGTFNLKSKLAFNDKLQDSERSLNAIKTKFVPRPSTPQENKPLKELKDLKEFNFFKNKKPLLGKINIEEDGN